MVQGDEAADEEGFSSKVADVGVQVKGAFCALGEFVPLAGGPGEEEMGGFGESFEVGDAVVAEGPVGLREVVAGGGGISEGGGGVGEVDVGAGELHFLRGGGRGVGQGRYRVPCVWVAGEHEDAGAVGGDGGALDGVGDARDESFGFFEPGQVLGQGPSLEGGDGDGGHRAGGEFGRGLAEIVGGSGEFGQPGESEAGLVAHQRAQVEA
ncbi:hypothetical protein ACFYNY_04875 [Streptomyces sp. NPDC006530]|uniref:hypothetical protein n=1 Tax=Streptomyces sp. NPDC006530 TaxID=3364750 RepID=UPI0036CB424F